MSGIMDKEKEDKMEERNIKEEIFLNIIMIGISILIGFEIGLGVFKKEVKIIRNPLLIYQDMRVMKLDYGTSQGLVGVIDEKDLKKVLGIKEAYEVFKESKERR